MGLLKTELRDLEGVWQFACLLGWRVMPPCTQDLLLLLVSYTFSNLSLPGQLPLQQPNLFLFLLHHQPEFLHLLKKPQLLFLLTRNCRLHLSNYTQKTLYLHLIILLFHISMNRKWLNIKISIVVRIHLYGQVGELYLHLVDLLGELFESIDFLCLSAFVSLLFIHIVNILVVKVIQILDLLSVRQHLFIEHIIDNLLSILFVLILRIFISSITLISHLCLYEIFIEVLHMLWHEFLF